MAKTKNEDVRIVILQRGWVMVGYFNQDGSKCWLTDGKVIRRWGTTRGLGEIAADGPTSSTLLDTAGRVDFHELNIIATLECEATKWSKHLA